jgi:hypothetical protein
MKTNFNQKENFEPVKPFYKKTIFVIPMFALMLIAFVSAGYIYSLMSTSHFQIEGKSNLTQIASFTGGELDTVMEAKNLTDTMVVYSAAPTILRGRVIIAETATNLDPLNCTEYLNDCHWTYSLNRANNTFVNGTLLENMNWQLGNNNISANLYCNKGSCNQERNAMITLIPTGGVQDKQ